MKTITLSKALNGYIVSTGEYGDKKSIYSNLDRAIDMVKKLMLDEERYNRERMEKNRNYKNSFNRED